jgi:hypothetical protein
MPPVRLFGGDAIRIKVSHDFDIFRVQYHEDAFVTRPDEVPVAGLPGAHNHVVLYLVPVHLQVSTQLVKRSSVLPAEAIRSQVVENLRLFFSAVGVQQPSPERR